VEIYLDKIKELYKLRYGKLPDTVIPIPPAGSERRYFRLISKNERAIGAWNPVKEENNAFIHFTQHFLSRGLHVPAILHSDPENNVYLVEDLGDNSLFKLLENTPPDSGFTTDLIRLYKESLKELIRFQVLAGKDLDYGFCYPHEAFGTRSMKWDLQYFKYYFLKLHVPFHESKLENDFEKLIDFLSQSKPEYFMYRDFQSRNIFIKDDHPYFIDYQGGRKGPLQYDVASLLFQVKADLPFDLRDELLDYYISELSLQLEFDKNTFKRLYYGFVLIRLLQVLGAYGFRGLIEKKPHFLSSIPFALKNLQWWIKNIDLGFQMPTLIPALKSLTNIKKYQAVDLSTKSQYLTVTIKSFSFKYGLPEDISGHGGGFVFDCRSLPNPGREERFRIFNGKDQIIIDFLKNDKAVLGFLEDTEKLVKRSIDNYLERGFGHLTLNFGCTGGQHRSVFCAETLAKKLREKYPDIIIDVEHIMLKI